MSGSAHRRIRHTLSFIELMRAEKVGVSERPEEQRKVCGLNHGAPMRHRQGAGGVQGAGNGLDVVTVKALLCLIEHRLTAALPLTGIEPFSANSPRWIT